MNKLNTNLFLSDVLVGTRYSNLQVVKKLGQGSFNSVWSTTDPKLTARVSTRSIVAKDQKGEEIKFIKRVNSKYPGTATAKMYFSYYVLGDYSLEIMEAYDRDLHDFFRDPKVSIKKKKKALIDSINLIGKLLDIGVYCWDQKPGNFLVMEKGKPSGYNGSRKKGEVFVRITDLGADFCVETKRLSPGRKDTRWGKRARCFSNSDKELFFMIEILQMCAMTIYADKKLKATVKSVFQMYDNELDICGRQEELKEFIKKNRPSWHGFGKMSSWNKIVKQLLHYGDGPANVFYDLKDMCRAGNPGYQKAHYKPIKSCSFGKLKTGKQPKRTPEKTPAGKILNPKTGRYVKINGKIGRRLRGRKAGKSCTSTQIVNPKTGRCVKINGKIGRRLMKNRVPLRLSTSSRRSPRSPGRLRSTIPDWLNV